MIMVDSNELPRRHSMTLAAFYTMPVIMKLLPPDMIVEANTVRFDSLSLDNGATLAPVDVAYETYGASERREIQRHPGAARLLRRRARAGISPKPASPAGGTT